MNLRSFIPFLRSRDESRARQTEPKQIQLASDFYAPIPSAGVTVNETTSLGLSAVFACVRNLAEDVAKLPFIVYRSVQPRGKERLPAHPLYRLLHDEPNSEMSAFDFRQALTACAVLWGRGSAEIERNNRGDAIALWPIEPWRITTERDYAGRLYYLVDGTVRLEPSEVLNINGFGLNGVVGMMMSKVGKESIGLTIAAQRFAASFFANGAKMSGVLSHPKTLTAGAVKNLRDSFSEMHAGAANAFKPLVLEEGTTWTQNSASPNEAQMLESRQFQVEDVARWFRMPPHKIQHLMRSTFSNIEHQGIEYVVDTLTPWLVRWEQETKRKLVDRADTGVFAEHLVAGLLRGDIQSRYAAYAVGRQNGWINGNEIRELENMNAIEGEGGDAYLINGTMITLDAAMNAGSPNTVAATVDIPDPAPDAEDDSAQVRSAIIEAHRPALVDAAQRAIRREVEVIRRKAKGKGDAGEAVATFYTTHNEYVRQALRPVVGSLVRSLSAVGADAVDADACVRSVASSHVSDATTQWASVFGPESDENRVETALNEWETGRFNTLIDRILEQTNGQKHD